MAELGWRSSNACTQVWLLWQMTWLFFSSVFSLVVTQMSEKALRMTSWPWTPPVCQVRLTQSTHIRLLQMNCRIQLVKVGEWISKFSNINIPELFLQFSPIVSGHLRPLHFYEFIPLALYLKIHLLVICTAAFRGRVSWTSKENRETPSSGRK